jgi:hypothetical protein
LTTFCGKNAEQIFAVFKQHSYFHHPKNLSFRALLFLWMISLTIFGGVAKIRKQAAADAALYAAALTAIGLLMMVATCFVTVFHPRFTLPMWELTIMSLSILFAEVMEFLRGCHSRTSWPHLTCLPQHHRLGQKTLRI